MIKRTLLAAVMAVFATGLFSVPAMAAHCPKDVKLIDAALKTSKMDAAMMTKVKAQRDEGNKLHTDKKHADSLKSLHAAMDALSLKH